ncbi:MAG TPA: sorbosone dehydrogenase family protein [Candidatus Polarisedimenticolia bacterium]|nr:sorbosone dehydrogenase family protein [Candidatus Polarisedimenticolia bacterium]
MKRCYQGAAIALGLASLLFVASHGEYWGLRTYAAAAGTPDIGPYVDFHGQTPGRVHRITPADLPKPYATKSVANPPKIVPRPSGAMPQAPAGFKVQLYADNLKGPRLIRTAPNGDLFVAESFSGRISVFRGMTKDGKFEKSDVFASGLRMPFGIAFYPPGPDPKYVYVGNNNAVVRFPYQNGDMKARGPAEAVVPELPTGGHPSRNVIFSLDGKQMFIAIGSRANVSDVDTDKSEFHRANILVANPDGSDLRIYASGIRNPVGIAVDPRSGLLWTSVNERDLLGDFLPPDYITHVEEGGFYGWPWYYIGGNQDPRFEGKHPELKDKVIVPDVLVQPHFASLDLTFYEAKQFPQQYQRQIFAAEHGSWNRSVRAGYEVIFVPLKDGRATGEYQDFLTGFVTPTGDVWGRPVGVAVAPDGSLMVTDDGSNSIWRVSYTKK